MKLTRIAASLVLLGACLPAAATDGYFSHGYGMNAKGMGGAAVAMSNDTFGGANNPASMVWVGSRFDLGVDWFSPKRDASRTGSLAGMNGSVNSESTNFLVPEFGYNRMLGNDKSLGISVYGNGGMNTDYPGGQIAAGNPVCAGFGFPSPGPYNLLCGTGKLGVDLSQLILAPTFAYKLAANHSIGVSPLFAYQRFKMSGVDSFQFFTSSMSQANLTNRGYDSSTGWGARLGWMSKLGDNFTFGAAYATKMKMGAFDKYKELFADHGGFDIPANMSVGIAFKPAPAFTLAADYQRINYSGVSSVGNASTVNSAFPGSANPPLPPGTVGSLGCGSCRGFGWKDINVAKLGVEYKYTPGLTLRAGYNRSENPIQARDVTFNILAPGVVQDHVTLGFTYALSQGSEITMAYMHAFNNSVSGSSLLNGFGVPAGSEKIQMYENSLGIAYSARLK